MAFKSDEVDALLASTGRLCCICKQRHKVQVHHIVHLHEGGTDDIENAIPLCPNCHDEVHSTYVPGRVTRRYSAQELKRHRAHTQNLSVSQASWTPGGPSWTQDEEIILMFAQCLDRAAFRDYFHQELSFDAFDQAMEDTLTAFNTGCWRLRDGTVIQRSKGKLCIAHAPWRDAMNEIVRKIEGIRSRFHRELGLDEMLLNHHRGRFYSDSSLSYWMDRQREEVIDIMNVVLVELNHSKLDGIGARR